MCIHMHFGGTSEILTSSAKPARRLGSRSSGGGEDGGADSSSTAAQSPVPSAVGLGIDCGAARSEADPRVSPVGSESPSSSCWILSLRRSCIRARRDARLGSRVVTPGRRGARGHVPRGLGCSGGRRPRWPSAAPGQDPLVQAGAVPSVRRCSHGKHPTAGITGYNCGVLYSRNKIVVF